MPKFFPSQRLINKSGYHPNRRHGRRALGLPDLTD